MWKKPPSWSSFKHQLSSYFMLFAAVQVLLLVGLIYKDKSSLITNEEIAPQS